MTTPALTCSTELCCAHGGRLSLLATGDRVRMCGATAVGVDATAVIVACPARPPCTTLRLAKTARVMLSGTPLALAEGAFSEPVGRPAPVLNVQHRVRCG